MPESNTATQNEAYRAPQATGSPSDMHPGPDLIDYLKDYARQKPEVAALWCFGLGFIIGWKLKPW